MGGYDHNPILRAEARPSGRRGVWTNEWTLNTTREVFRPPTNSISPGRHVPSNHGSRGLYERGPSNQFVPHTVCSRLASCPSDGSGGNRCLGCRLDLFSIQQHSCRAWGIPPIFLRQYEYALSEIPALQQRLTTSTRHRRMFGFAGPAAWVGERVRLATLPRLNYFVEGCSVEYFIKENYRREKPVLDEIKLSWPAMATSSLCAMLPADVIASAVQGNPMRHLTISRKKRSICLAALFWITLVWAQVAHSCEISVSKNSPLRQIISCGDAVTIEREPTAEVKIIKRPNEAAPRAMQVQGGAILITVSPGRARPKVRTPHAIATVRGTTYIVDAGTDQTSVFVLDGDVDVRRPTDAAAVRLRAGDGTDVTLDESPSVRRWGAARAEALLARFGR